MQIIPKPAELQAVRKTLSGSVGFVPTMGNLHEGHASLLKRSREENDISILSIFVNPTQFNNPDDFKCYPKTLDHDLALAEKLGVDYVFAPQAEDMYPDNYTYKVCEHALSTEMEGKFRPGHFDGVLTVLVKLFSLIHPTRAYFGEKDYQQYLLVKNMAEALFLDVTIIGCPIQRNENGFPLSSRNNLFTAEQFAKAQVFPQIFHANLSPTEITAQLTDAGFTVDYIQDWESRRFAAVWFEGIRLIDNIQRTGEACRARAKMNEEP